MITQPIRRKSSPIANPEGKSYAHHPSRKVTQLVGKLVGILSNETPLIVEPVSEELLTVGSFIAEHTTPKRLAIVEARVVSNRKSEPYKTEDVKEYLHSDRYSHLDDSRPMPQAVLTLYGKDYKTPAVY